MDTRGGNTWHTRQRTDITPPSRKGSSRALTVPSGRGGGRSGGPSGQTRTGTQDGDLQSGTDRQGPWRSWELWRPWRCRELRRPWQVVFGALASVPSAWPPQPEPFLPPQKISLGKLGGIRSPPGLNRQDKTGTGQPTGTGSPPGLSSEAEASSGHDEESGALTGSLSNRFHLSDKGAGGWEWPPWPLNKEPPAPDESPWTRQGKFKMFLWAQQNRHTALLAVTCGLDPRG